MNFLEELNKPINEKEGLQSKEDKKEDDIKDINKKIEEKVKELERKRGNRIFLFLGNDIDGETVTEVFEKLRKEYSENVKKLDVIVDSGGGDIHSAYNLATLFREYGSEELNFIIPRWSKSASTLLVCGGDKIFMTKIAELGPLDPQITEINPIEERIENYTPLQLESTLSLIRKEINIGDGRFGEALLKRLQFPMTLGGIMKSIELGEQYLKKLLLSRMFNEKEIKIVEKISDNLTKGYCDHGFCINLNEARDLGLKVNEIPIPELDIIWEIYSLYMKKEKMKRKINKEKMLDVLEDLPEDLKKILDKRGIRKSKEDKDGRD